MQLIKEDEDLEPVSPLVHYLNNKVLSVSILGILESEIPIDDSQAMSLIKDVFLPINPRFSSIMVIGKKGGRKWKKVEVNVENHVYVPNFSSQKGSSSPSENDSFLKSYILQIDMQPFPEGQPLWEIHIIKCPTSEAQGTVIFKLHHALGDGYSLVGALLSCLQRADDPSIPITFPSVNKDDRSIGLRKAVSKYISLLINTVRDFSLSVLKSTCIQDDLSPIRSGSKSFLPFSVSMNVISLDRIKEIKSHLRVTINDVITGIIFLATRLYMQRANRT
ncbi:hypothetical protein BT93_E0802 [Corymbia citriodora subsp. variegata]|nr:hypothetical protein BT93_E0802 [Corymbia citriodora subsp. variegata]